MKKQKIADKSFKKREKHPCRTVIFSKDAGWSNYFDISNNVEPRKSCKKGKTNKNNKTPKCYDQFLEIGFTCLEAVAPLRADRFLLTATSSGIPGTHSVIPVTSERWSTKSTIEQSNNLYEFPWPNLNLFDRMKHMQQAGIKP